MGSFWLRLYPNVLGLTQRKKHFVKIAALLLNNLSSYSLFLFGRQKLNIDLWERDTEGTGEEGQRRERPGRRERGSGEGRTQRNTSSGYVREESMPGSPLSHCPLSRWFHSHREGRSLSGPLKGFGEHSKQTQPVLPRGVPIDSVSPFMTPREE